MSIRIYIGNLPQNLHLDWLKRWRDKEDKLFHPSNLLNGDVIKKNLKIEDGPLLGELLQYLSKELAYKRLNNFDEAIYKAKQWICLLYTSPSPRDNGRSRMPSSA